MSAKSPSFDQALQYAYRWHAGQTRTKRKVPFVTHFVAVAEILAYHYPDRPHLTIAGLLHDILEDTPQTYNDLERKFGQDIAHLVRGVTKPAKRDLSPEIRQDPYRAWRIQREHMLELLEPHEKDILRLRAADGVHNLMTKTRDGRWVGPQAWQRPGVTKEDQLWYFEEILQRVKAGLGDEPLVLELEESLRKARES